MLTLLHRASSPRIVHALADFYGVASASTHLGMPCGRRGPTDGLHIWLASWWPFAEKEWRAIYVYMPLKQHWDCFEGESFFDVNPAFRSPCLCQPPPPVHFSDAIWTGLVVGMVVPFLALVFGFVWDDIERRGSWLPSKWKDVSWRFRVRTSLTHNDSPATHHSRYHNTPCCMHPSRWQVAVGASLHVCDHAMDLFVVYYFFYNAEYLYMGAAIAILASYAIASAVIASFDSPLRPVAGDVVSLKPGVVSLDGGELADVVAVSISTSAPRRRNDLIDAGVRPRDLSDVSQLRQATQAATQAAHAAGAAAQAATDVAGRIAASNRRPDRGARLGYHSPPPSPPHYSTNEGSGTAGECGGLAGAFSSKKRSAGRGGRHQTTPERIEEEESEDEGVIHATPISAVKPRPAEVEHLTPSQNKPSPVLMAAAQDVKMLVRLQWKGSARDLLPKTHEQQITLDDIDEFAPARRRLKPCGTNNCCLLMCCNMSVAFALGLVGAAAPFEALRILIWDPEHSRCWGCVFRGTGQETAAFGILRLVQAQTEAAPMLFLVAMVFTFEGIRKVFMEQPLLFVTALVSLINCAFALTHFLTSPATEASHRARDELLVHVYDGDDEPIERHNGHRRERGPRTPPRRSFPMILHLGLMAFFVSDLTLRVVALCVLSVAVGDTYAALLLPGLVGAWVVCRFTICCLSCGGVGGYGYRDLVSLVEGFVRDLKRLFTPSFLDSAVTARRLSYDFLCSTVACVLLTVLGLQPWMPNPHVDPDLIALTIVLTTASVITKYVTFVWCVFPGLTLRYSVFGVGKVYSALDEAVAAITVQRRYREILRSRNFRGAGLSYHMSSRSSTASAPRTRKRAGTEVQLNFVRRINLMKRGEDRFERVQQHCWRSCEHWWGLVVYMISLGFFCKQYGQSEFEDRADEVLSEMLETQQQSLGEDLQMRSERLRREKKASARSRDLV